MINKFKACNFMLFLLLSCCFAVANIVPYFNCFYRVFFASNFFRFKKKAQEINNELVYLEMGVFRKCQFIVKSVPQNLRLLGNFDRCVGNAFDFSMLITKADSLISPNELGFEKEQILIRDMI